MPTVQALQSGIVRPGTKAAAKRQRILDAAAKMFSANGYTGTRLTDIAKEAGTQAGSLYYHFASRDDLVREVLRVGQQHTSDFVVARVAALSDDATGLDRLREAMTAHLEAVLEIGDYTAATLRIMGQVPDEIRGPAQASQRTYGHWWKDLYAAAADEGVLRTDLNLDACRMLVLGSMNYSFAWYQPHRPRGLNVRQLEEQIAAMFLDGLATATGRRRRSPLMRVPRASPPDATGPDTRAAATTARILDAAAKVFRANGYAGTRLADVAEAAGMRAGSLYYHFDSREDLVTRLIRDAWERTDAQVRGSMHQLPPRASAITRLATALDAHMLAMLGGADYTSAMLRIVGQLPPEVRGTVVPWQRAYRRLFHELLDAAIAAGEVRDDLDRSVVLMTLIGALDWTVEWYTPQRYPAPDELARQFGLLAFDGMAVRRRRQSIRLT